jgi:hypothetical protein
MSMIETKTIGSSGQISFGKHNAGKTVTIEELNPGVWMVKTALVIPESEFILHTEPYKSRLSEAIAWAEQNPAQASDLKALAATLEPPKTSRKRSRS